jgi:Flp pilus assembly protein TadG
MRLTADESGSNLVEFAITLTILLTAIFGVLDFSRAIYAEHFVGGAAKDATRYAMVRGSTYSGTACATYASFNCVASSANVTSLVMSTVPQGMTAANVSVTTNWPGTLPTGAACDSVNGANSPTCVVTVHVSYPFKFMLPFLPKTTLTLSSSSTSTIVE